MAEEWFFIAPDEEEVEKSFPGHKGRPGKVGGSLPRKVGAKEQAAKDLRAAILGSVSTVKKTLHRLGWPNEKLNSLNERQLRMLARKRQPASAEDWLRSRSLGTLPATRCKSCAGKVPKERERRAALMRKLHKDTEFKANHQQAMVAKRRPPNHCIDCSTEIGPNATRCSNCAARARWKDNRKTMLAGVQNPDRNRKISEARNRDWADPEYRKWQSEINSKENHPNWQGGLSFEPYTPDFDDGLKFQVRKRDNFTCVVCGTKENGRAHDCHHIDYDKKNNAEDNLVTLCVPCHRKTNFNRDYWQAYFTGEDYHLMLGAC